MVNDWPALIRRVVEVVERYHRKEPTWRNEIGAPADDAYRGPCPRSRPRRFPIIRVPGPAYGAATRRSHREYPKRYSHRERNKISMV